MWGGGCNTVVPEEEEGDTEGLVSCYHTIDNLKEKKRKWANKPIG